MYKLIITHPGVFHADEALGVATLFQLLLDQTPPLERREPTEEELNDPQVIVLDVGGQFDPARSNFDHHQRGGVNPQGVMAPVNMTADGQRDVSEGYGVEGKENPFASAGLIWNAFPELLSVPEFSAEENDLFHARVDKLLYRGVDAADCGVGDPAVGGSPSLSQIISWLNPPPGAGPDWRDSAFEWAVEIASSALDGAKKVAQSWVQARSVVLNAEVAVPHVLTLEKCVPWQEHIFSRPDEDELLYVVFPSERGGFMLQQVPEAPESFQGRKPLPEAWAGLRGEELAEACGVEDAVFVHPGRFCGGAESLKSTLKMACKAIDA